MGEQEQMIKNAVGELRPFIKQMLASPEIDSDFTLSAKEEVYARYQPVFSPENVGSITEDEFKSFLIYDNNHHWKGLQKQGGKITADMELLRKALSILVDESIPIQERLDQIRPNSGPMVRHLGKAVITAILLVLYPDKYGAMNKASVEGMRLVRILPKFERGASFGERYTEFNDILLKLSSELSIDLWTLDAVWYRIGKSKDDSDESDVQEALLEEGEKYVQGFGLEKYLQGFLRDNWDKIHNFDDWELYEEDGEVVGFEFNTGEIGRIDLLARHKNKLNWLVIELKRNQGSDQALGQVLRYMGWVSENLAGESDQVQGMIICKEIDLSLKYAIKMTRDIDVLPYKVHFDLEVNKGM